MPEQPGYLVTRLRRALAQLPLLPRALGLVWRAAPRQSLQWSALLVAQGLLPVAVVYTTRALVDSMVSAVGGSNSGATLRPALLLVGLMAGLLLAGELLKAFTRWVRLAQSELVQDHVSQLIHARAAAADVALYESPSYYDSLHRARVDAYHRPLALVENLGGLLQSGLTLIAMAAVLLPYGWWIPVALLVSAIPAMVVVMRYAYLQHQWRLNATEDERRAAYYEWALTSRETVQELRLLALADHFRSAFQDLRRGLREARLGLVKREVAAEIVAGSFALLIMGAAMLWMVVRAARGQVTLGDVALFYQAFNQGQRLMRSLFESAGQVYSNSLFLGNLFHFLSLKPRIADPEQPLPAITQIRSGVVFRDVHFGYPETERAVLDGCDLEVPAGQIVALLGANGSGKSTAVKLLCRFYDPDSGQIEVDGTDLRQLRLEDVRRLTAVLFQQPVHWDDTVRRNIDFGDVGRQVPFEEVTKAAEATGADAFIRRLDGEYDAQLGHWFSHGSELSVGEWQRIALTRAFVRDAPFLLLDEPTAMMDAWATADWFQRLREVAHRRTALVITHSLITARHADAIRVLKQGRIVEAGTHAELIERGGPYAEAWNAHRV